MLISVGHGAGVFATHVGSYMGIKAVNRITRTTPIDWFAIAKTLDESRSRFWYQIVWTPVFWVCELRGCLAKNLYESAGLES